MNASEKEITGVEDMNGLGSIRDAIMQQAVTLASICAREEAQEKARTEARVQDNHWRDRMEQKTDKQYARLDELGSYVEKWPQIIDTKVAAGIKTHADEDTKRARLQRTILLSILVVVVVAVAATLEFIDKEHVAAAVLAIAAGVSPLVVWLLNRN